MIFDKKICSRVFNVLNKKRFRIDIVFCFCFLSCVSRDNYFDLNCFCYWFWNHFKRKFKLICRLNCRLNWRRKIKLSCRLNNRLSCRLSCRLNNYCFFCWNFWFINNNIFLRKTKIAQYSINRWYHSLSYNWYRQCFVFMHNIQFRKLRK